MLLCFQITFELMRTAELFSAALGLSDQRVFRSPCEEMWSWKNWAILTLFVFLLILNMSTEFYLFSEKTESCICQNHS